MTDRPDNVRTTDIKQHSDRLSDDLAGFSSCSEPPPIYQRFYQRSWQEVDSLYFDPPALKDFGQYEHKYDQKLCTPGDLDLALKKMTESLHNPWTKYTSAGELEAKRNREALGLAPSGFELAQAGDKFKIEFIHYGTPAQKSNLREGDIVDSIDGKSLSGLSVSDARALQLGKVGDAMKVGAEHKGQKEQVTLTIAPNLEQEKVDSRLLDDNIGYVRLPDFKGEARIEEFIQSLEQLQKKGTDGKLKGLVLDLRHDPGGDLPNAVTVASLFLDDDKLVARQFVRSHDEKDLDGLRSKDLTVTPARGITVNGKFVDEQLVLQLRKLPLVVLVNGSSASASEVLTGALKDNARATIVGSHTFGKGVGYKTEQTFTGGLLGITAMKYVSPKGEDPNGKGFTPDLEIENQPGDRGDTQLNKAVSLLK